MYKPKCRRPGRPRGHPPLPHPVTPQQVKESLTSDQSKLYKLIWERFIASQMAMALYDTVSVEIEATTTCSRPPATL